MASELEHRNALVLHHLIRHGKERVWLSGEEKAELLEQYGFLCALCGRKASLFEWDHALLGVSGGSAVPAPVSGMPPDKDRDGEPEFRMRRSGVALRARSLGAVRGVAATPAAGLEGQGVS